MVVAKHSECIHPGCTKHVRAVRKSAYAKLHGRSKEQLCDVHWNASAKLAGEIVACETTAAESAKKAGPLRYRLTAAVLYVAHERPIAMFTSRQRLLATAVVACFGPEMLQHAALRAAIESTPVAMFTHAPDLLLVGFARCLPDDDVDRIVLAEGLGRSSGVTRKYVRGHLIASALMRHVEPRELPQLRRQHASWEAGDRSLASAAAAACACARACWCASTDVRGQVGCMGDDRIGVDAEKARRVRKMLNVLDRAWRMIDGFTTLTRATARVPGGTLNMTSAFMIDEFMLANDLCTLGR
jgi:hypothetical protein